MIFVAREWQNMCDNALDVSQSHIPWQLLQAIASSNTRTHTAIATCDHNSTPAVMRSSVHVQHNTKRAKWSPAELLALRTGNSLNFCTKLAISHRSYSVPFIIVERNETEYQDVDFSSSRTWQPDHTYDGFRETTIFRQQESWRTCQLDKARRSNHHETGTHDQIRPKYQTIWQVQSLQSI